MYEDIYNLTGDFAGKILYPKSGNSLAGQAYPQLTASGDKYKVITFEVGINAYAQLTGRYFAMNKDVAYQVILYKFTTENIYGYILDSDLNLWTSTKTVDGDLNKTQNLVDSIISNHQNILESNLMCARIITYCRDNGIALPADSKQRLYTLQSRLIKRNEYMKSSGYLTDIQEAESPNFSVYNDDLTNFMNNPGIGVVPIVAIVVWAVVLLATGIVAIQIYKLFTPVSNEAIADVKYSNELETQLVKYLPPETYELLKQENAANAEQWQKKLDAAKGQQLMTTAKYIGFGVLAIWGFDKFNNILSKNK